MLRKCIACNYETSMSGNWCKHQKTKKHMATLKGGEFLIKEIPANDIFTLQELSEEQKMLRDSAKEFIDREVIPQKERIKKAKKYLQMIGLGDRLEHTSSQLSGGQQQRVAIARALVRDPAIYLFDEPTVMMDSSSEAAFILRIKEILKAHKTLILVTHRPSLLAFVDRILVIDGGRVVADGPKQQVLEALQTAATKTSG